MAEHQWVTAVKSPLEECTSYFTLLSQLVVVATPEICRKPQVVLFPHLWLKPHPGWKQPLANRDPGIHLFRVFRIGIHLRVWNFELLPAFFFGKKMTPKFVCFFWTRELEKNLANRHIFFFDFVEDWKEFLKVLGFTQSFIHFCFGPFCRLGMEQTLLHRVSNRFLVILSKVPDDTGPRKFIPSWVSQTIWPNSFFFLRAGFKYFIFSPLLGEDFHFDWYSSNGLVKNH